MSIMMKGIVVVKYSSVLQYVRDLLLHNTSDGNQFEAGTIKAIIMHNSQLFLKHPLGKYIQFSDGIGKRRVTHLKVDSGQLSTYDMLQTWMN